MAEGHELKSGAWTVPGDADRLRKANQNHDAGGAHYPIEAGYSRHDQERKGYESSQIVNGYNRWKGET